MRRLLFAANWKMHFGPKETREFAARFLPLVSPGKDRDVWFFPPAVSLVAAADAFQGRSDIRIGAQDVHWESKGAFTGAISPQLAQSAGATASLVGHSERRRLFGETDEQTGRKVRALLKADLTPVLCVGETLTEREANQTVAVVERQLEAALKSLSAEQIAKLVIAYEPVWAIGTGKNATPEDAAIVHQAIRANLAARGVAGRLRILYGGSVTTTNALVLLAQEELDGVLVGGASLDAEAWAEIVGLGA